MKIHYFQRYTKKEDVATANTMLLLSRLYSYSTNKFYRLLNDLFFGEEGFDPELQFVIQDYGKDSIPDATITQESFKLVIETKTTDWFYKEQLLKHLSKFDDEKHQVLITLSSELMNQKKKKEFEKELAKYNETNHTNILHINTTFEMIAKEFERVIDSRDYEMIDVIEDYYSFLRSSDLINNADNIMRVQLAGKTFDFNVCENVYYDSIQRGFRAHKYLGLYTNKSVRAVGEITDIVTATKKQDGSLKYVIEKGELTDEIKRKIDLSIEDGQKRGWDLDNHRYFIVKEFVETDYAKTSSGAPMGSRIFDLEEIFGKNKIPNDAHSLAERLLDFTWE